MTGFTSQLLDPPNIITGSVYLYTIALFLALFLLEVCQLLA